MKQLRAEFVVSASAPSNFPKPELPEIAFAGRSNVGKSSLINALVGQTGLARTSNTPGRTRLLNWFRVEASGKPYFLVDLPGYGYARVPRAMRASWGPLVEGFLERPVVCGVILLIDIRRGAEKEERELLEFLSERKIATLAVLTKADKLAKSRRKPVATALTRELGLARPALLCSAHSGEGIDDLRKAVHAMKSSRSCE